MRAPALPFDEVAPGVVRFADTCNVYVLRSGRDAVLIDFGSGAVLDQLAELDVDRVTDVLVTHHHRDQVQGLDRAAAAGARVWVPPVEQDLIARVDRHWLGRQIDNDYDLRQDRFSLLEPVAITGCVAEYRTTRFGSFDVYALPTPGHTTGSVSYLVEVEGRRLAFTGDLVYGDGKVWSLAATQWSYTGVEGQAATVLSCAVLAERAPDVLLPSHGPPVEDPPAALSLTRARLKELIDLRHEWQWDLDAWLERPWVALTPHLLRNRTSLATTYALLSDSGAALFLDFGYDLTSGTPPVSDRAARRPLLATLDALRRDFGVDRVDVVLPTHYHDDHVAGINLLRDVEGAQVWATENVAPVLERPQRYDLPCLWFDPIPVDRVLAHGDPVTWHEYELTTYPLPGHTLHAAAIAFDVDGRRVVAIGDQQSFQDDGRSILNYQYRNRFRIDDYVRSAELYRELRPDLLLTGHSGAREVDDALLARLDADGRRVAELHRELLPLEEVDFGAEGFAARIEPYRSTVATNGVLELNVTVRNPFDRPATAVVRLVVPDGWGNAAPSHDVELRAHAEATLRFETRVGATPVHADRVAADVTIDGAPFGQQAEALVTVE
jgi:glyoxylase-like metal-dependent hydrolase (beta-lactamase superfamily II)